MVAYSCLYQDREASNSEAGNRGGGAASFKRWMAGILRWENRALRRKTSKEVSDMEHSWLPGCQDDD